MKTILLSLFAVTILFSCNKPQGKITMTYQKATAVYGDLDSVRNLPLLTVQQPIINPGRIYVGNDYILVGEEGKGIHIFNNTNLYNPVRMSFIQIPFNKDFFVKNGKLYAESLYDVLKIDLSDVYNPVLIDRAVNVFGTPIKNDKGESLINFEYTVATDEFTLNSPEAKEIEKRGRLHLDYKGTLLPESLVPSSFTNSNGGAGTLNRIADDFGHLYVLTDDKLHILNNGLNNLNYVRSIELDEGMETVYTYNHKIFIGSRSSMLMYSASDAANPSKISEFDHEESCDPVLPNGNTAYLTLRSVENEGCAAGENALSVIDISDNTSPNSIEEIPLDTPYGMTLIDNLLFVAQGQNGFTVFDATDANDLEKLAEVNGVEAYDIMLHPYHSNVIIMTNSSGIAEYSIDFNTFSVSPLGTINY